MTILDDLAARYEAVRAEEPTSRARTSKVSAIAGEAVAVATMLASPAESLALLGASSREGARLMRILIAFAHKGAANLPWLIEMNGAFATRFEHYWCVVTLIEHVPFMSAADRARIDADLTARWQEIDADPGRTMYARWLQEMTRA